MGREGLVRLLEDNFADFTPTGKRIADYLLSNLLQIPFETAEGIARQTGTTGISVGRFLRQIGFQNLEDLKQSLRGSGQTWLMADRLDSVRELDNTDTLSDSLKLELKSIEHVYTLARTEDFKEVVQKIIDADAVFIIGIQSTRGIANSFFCRLEYIRPHVFYVDGLSGAYIECLNSEFKNPYIIIADFKAYAAVTRKICAAACKRDIGLVLITEHHCTWARTFPIDLLQINVDVGQFWDSHAPLATLFNLLASGVVKGSGTQLEQRLKLNKQLQVEFGQFEI